MAATEDQVQAVTTALETKLGADRAKQLGDVIGTTAEAFLGDDGQVNTQAVDKFAELVGPGRRRNFGSRTRGGVTTEPLPRKGEAGTNEAERRFGKQPLEPEEETERVRRYRRTSPGRIAAERLKRDDESAGSWGRTHPDDPARPERKHPEAVRRWGK